jgi:hypothetical protein
MVIFDVFGEGFVPVFDKKPTIDVIGGEAIQALILILYLAARF